MRGLQLQRQTMSDISAAARGPTRGYVVSAPPLFIYFSGKCWYWWSLRTTCGRARQVQVTQLLRPLEL